MTCKTLLITAAALFLAAGAAHAGDKPSTTVKIDDLNLTSPHDAQRLYDRLYEAASLVCGRGPLVTFFMLPNTEFVACRDAALDAALSQFHAPLVVSLRQRAQAPDRVATR